MTNRASTTIIEKRRTELGLSHEQLADLARIHPVDLLHYETGETEPRLPVARRLANALDITLDQLADDAPDEPIDYCPPEPNEDTGSLLALARNLTKTIATAEDRLRNQTMRTNGWALRAVQAATRKARNLTTTLDTLEQQLIERREAPAGLPPETRARPLM